MADNRFAGKQRALDRMKRIPVAVRIAAREELDAQAAALVEKIRPRVPRDHGELAESLEWHRSPRVDKLSVVITEGRDQEGDPENRKARAVEFGRPDMEAQPHFFPTYRENKRKMRAALARRVRSAIRKIWGAP